MPEIATLIAYVLANSQVKAAIGSLTKEITKVGQNALIRRLSPSASERAATKAIELFMHEWNTEMEACSFDSAHEGYRDQLQKLVQISAAEIADFMSPATREIDLSLIASFWSTLGLDALPGQFDWHRVAQNYARAISRYITRDPELRGAYDTVLHERATEAVERSTVVSETAAWT